jgi:hypothetical protein
LQQNQQIHLNLINTVSNKFRTTNKGWANK